MKSKIHITPERLRALVRQAYDEGWQDRDAQQHAVFEMTREFAWAESAVADNLEQDLALAKQQGGKYP